MYLKLLSTFAIYFTNLNFGVVFPQKYPSESHIRQMRMVQLYCWQSNCKEDETFYRWRICKGVYDECC